MYVSEGEERQRVNEGILGVQKHFVPQAHRLGRQNPGLKKGPHERLRGASAMAIYTPLQRALQLGSHGVARLLRSEEAARENADDGSRDRHNSAHHSWEEAACTATEAELSASITDKKGFAVCVRGRIRRRPLCREHGNELRTRTRNQTARKRRARSPAACLIACPSGGMTLYIYIYIYTFILPGPCPFTYVWPKHILGIIWI